MLSCCQATCSDWGRVDPAPENTASVAGRRSVCRPTTRYSYLDIRNPLHPAALDGEQLKLKTARYIAAHYTSTITALEVGHTHPTHECTHIMLLCVWFMTHVTTFEAASLGFLGRVG